MAPKLPCQAVKPRPHSTSPGPCSAAGDVDIERSPAYTPNSSAMKRSTSELLSGIAARIRSSGHSHHAIRSSAAICSSPKRRRISRAGLPIHTAYGLTSLATTAEAPMTAPFPTVTPERMRALRPNPDIVPDRDVALGCRDAVAQGAWQAELDPEGVGRNPIQAVIAAHHELHAIGDRAEGPDINRRVIAWVGNDM